MAGMQQVNEQEYMALAQGVGIIPAEFRNRAYDKLQIEPGTGGLGEILAATQSKQQTAGTDAMDAFLAGVAAGADPAELAKQLRSDTKTTGRRRASREEAS